MVEIKKITYTDNLRQGTDKINSNFDTVVDEIKAVDDRVDNIIVGGGPDKDPELVDIRTVDPNYTPQREINVAGDVTRDMQANFTQLETKTNNHIDDKNNPHETNSEQINVIDPKDASVLASEYPLGLTAFVVSGAVTGWPESTGLVVNYRPSPLRTTQYFYSNTGLRNYIRKWHNSNGVWLEWQEIITALYGSGSPEGSVSAPVGSLYKRTDGGAGTIFYIKESGTGNTGWKAVQTA